MELSEFISQTRSLTVPAAFFLGRLKVVERLCSDILYAQDHEIDLDARISKTLRERCDLRSTICLLSSGGADSTYLMSMLRRTLPDANIVAYFAATANNAPEFVSVEIMADKVGAEVVMITPQKSDLEFQIGLFQSKFERLPRDVAQPLHNHIVQRAKSDWPDGIIMDGQYADTLMFANPQNMFFDWWKLCTGNGSLSKILRRLGLGRNIKVVSGEQRMSDLLRSSGLSVEALIQWLCRIETSSSVRNAIAALCGPYPASLVFQSLFYDVLLGFREADKYRLHNDVFSPFDDLSLLSDAFHRQSYYNSLFGRKRPVWQHIRMHHPELRQHVKRRSFEPI